MGIARVGNYRPVTDGEIKRGTVSNHKRDDERDAGAEASGMRKRPIVQATKYRKAGREAGGEGGGRCSSLFSPSRFRGFPGRAAARYPAEAFPAAFFFCDFLGEAAAPKPMLFPRGCVSTRPLRSARSGAKRAIIFCPAKKKKGDRAARVNSAHRWTQRTAAVFFEVQLCARARDGSTTAAKQRRPGDSEKRRASCENTRAPRVLSTKAHDRDKGISYFKGPPFLSDHLERKRERSALPCRDYRRFPPVSILRHAAIRLHRAFPKSMAPNQINRSGMLAFFRHRNTRKSL